LHGLRGAAQAEQHRGHQRDMRQVGSVVAAGAPHSGRQPPEEQPRERVGQAVLAVGGRCPQCGLMPGPAEIVIRLKEGRTSRRSDPVAVALRAPHRLLEPLET
jgi:hypothetical protein